MKSFTDLEQSRKLSEFLSSESADMEYLYLRIDGSMVNNYLPFVKDSCAHDVPSDRTYDFIDCWSLSALLSIINNIKGWYPGIDSQVEDNKWQICMFSRETGSDTSLSSMNEELVDVCYEVIIKLHDKNLI